MILWKSDKSKWTDLITLITGIQRISKSPARSPYNENENQKRQAPFTQNKFPICSDTSHLNVSNIQEPTEI
jgi:hypothetical protein